MRVAFEEGSGDPPGKEGSGSAEPLGVSLAGIVAGRLGVGTDALFARGRGPARIAYARQLAIYLARTRLGLSFTEAGRLFGRDRTTASHACRRVEESRDEPAVDRLIEGLDRQVGRRLSGMHNVAARP